MQALERKGKFSEAQPTKKTNQERLVANLLYASSTGRLSLPTRMMLQAKCCGITLIKSQIYHEKSTDLYQFNCRRTTKPAVNCTLRNVRACF
jgi:hypothetical protein